jgi:sugar phosphate isomerase/epimerase
MVLRFLNPLLSYQIRLLATKFSNISLHHKLDGRIGAELMGRPKIGLSMLFCLGEPFDTMIKRLATVKTRYVEIVDDGFHTLNRGRVSKLAEAAKCFGLEYTLHSPFADINIASPSKPLLNAILRRLRQSIGWASDLNARLWVLHPGLVTGISMFYPGMEWKQNIQSIQDLLKFAGDYGVNVGLETMPGRYGFIMKNTEDFLRFYRESGLEMGIVLDTGHANLEGQIESYLRAFPSKIVHIHASDNLGETDQHLGIGYGRIDWKRFAETLKEIAYSKTLITESTEHVDESMQKLEQLVT